MDTQDTKRRVVEIEVIRSTPPELDRCSAPDCGRMIEWVMTRNGKRLPVDYPLVPNRMHERLDGSFVVIIDGGRSHFATCPKAATFRKR